MLEIIILLSKILGLAFVITHFSPIQWVLDAIRQRVKKPISRLLFDLITIPTWCISCCSFWLGLAMGGLWYGVTVYIVAYVYNQKVAPWMDKIKLF